MTNLLSDGAEVLCSVDKQYSSATCRLSKYLRTEASTVREFPLFIAVLHDDTAVLDCGLGNAGVNREPPYYVVMVVNILLW